ncbi:MAG TPA: DUF3127 domain-containing protein [Saprospiraceae bacterium]|nr:DUF3127 domain-containing protein [Saprospiraceae bacterium]HMP23604.1 DUF3127 domain-containing protein [Saprospiraceae bacterium]
MTSFEIEGKLHKAFETENKTSSFQAREFVIEVADGTYSQFVKFQLTQDRCALLDAYKEGEIIKVHFDLRGREWQGKYFTNLNAWRIEKGQAADAAPEYAPPPPAAADFPSAADEPAAADDDLPF